MGNTIGAQTTAVALLFRALGGYTQPPSVWSQMLNLIAATPQASALADTAKAIAAQRQIMSDRWLATGLRCGSIFTGASGGHFR